MAEYIDRNELIENLKKFASEHFNDLIKMLIEKQPTADVMEVKHGKWIWKELYGSIWSTLVCSECEESEGANKNFDYCPHCGAKMDGGSNK